MNHQIITVDYQANYNGCAVLINFKRDLELGVSICHWVTSMGLEDDQEGFIGDQDDLKHYANTIIKQKYGNDVVVKFVMDWDSL